MIIKILQLLVIAGLTILILKYNNNLINKYKVDTVVDFFIELFKPKNNKKKRNVDDYIYKVASVDIDDIIPDEPNVELSDDVFLTDAALTEDAETAITNALKDI